MADDTERVAMSIRLPRQLTTRLDTYAAGKGISRNAAIAVLLDRALAQAAAWTEREKSRAALQEWLENAADQHVQSPDTYVSPPDGVRDIRWEINGRFGGMTFIAELENGDTIRTTREVS